MNSRLEIGYNAQRSAHERKQRFLGGLDKIYNRHQYRYSKHNILDWMMQAILVGRFGLSHLASGKEVPEDAKASVAEFVDLYVGAVAAGWPFDDLLGPAYMEVLLGSRNRENAAFYTPTEVSRMMAQMAVGDADDFKGPELFRFSDPCVGGGSLALAFLAVVAETHGPSALENISVTGVDISYYGARLAAIQLLTNIYVHELTLGEVAIVRANSLVMDPNDMTVVCHALRKDLGATTADPRQILFENREALAAQAAPTYESYQQLGLDLNAIASGPS